MSPTAALPAECLVTVSVTASCAIPGCPWQYVKHSTYDRMPSVKAVYRAHIKTDHPGFIISKRSHGGSTLITPSMLDLVRIELAAVVGG